MHGVALHRGSAVRCYCRVLREPNQHDEQAEAYGRKPLPWQASPENHVVMDLSEHVLSGDGPFHFYGASFVHS